MVTAMKLIRMSQRMPQDKVAKLTGISRSYYSMIESGRYLLLPEDPIRKRLEKVFKKPADELLKPVVVEKVI